MITWSRRHILISGIVLILAANAIVLAGVASNRSGEPESTVQLSERELRLPYAGGTRTENSGVVLNLVWRAPVETAAQDPYSGYESSGGNPDWLDKAKLAALGFDVAQDQKPAAGNFKWQRTKEVLLVLELDGVAYRQALQRARQKASDEEKLNETNPGSKEFTQRSKAAKDWLAREENENSRLFVIDAGLDAVSLRVKYPDRARYLIVRGQVRPQIVTHDKMNRLSGHVAGLSIGQINVPVEFQPALQHTAQNNARARFAVTVAFGQRLEPWILVLNGNKADAK